MSGTAADQDLGTAETSPEALAGKRVVFTGRLASMSHAEARDLVGQLGGRSAERVSRRTHLVVVGEEGWPLTSDGRLPRQIQRAGRYKRLGLPLEIIAETEFLARAGLLERQDEIHRHYTPAMLSRILELPVTTIRRWARQGLIRPVRSVLRMPYFDFQEVAGAKVLARLVEEGVSAERIADSLAQLRAWLPGVERPLVQLGLLAEDGQMRVRRGAQLVEPSGQKLLEFDAASEDRSDDEDPTPAQAEASSDGKTASMPVVPFPGEARAGGLSAEGWFRQGAQLEEENELDAACSAFHHALLLGGPRPETCFHLANVLYRLGQPHAAAERFRNALELEPDYVEAWNNLGSVLSELGQPEAAVDAFRCALSVHDHFADAHYNLADTLEDLNRHDEAVPHWEAYLRHDTRSAWADEARRRLEAASDLG